MNKKYFAVAACILIQGTVANATDWKSLDTSGSFSLSFDPSSVRHLPDGRTKAWFLKNYPNEQPAEGAFIRQPFKSAKELEIFDCKQGTFALGMIIYYTGDAGRGTSAGAFQPLKSPAQEDMFDVVPGSTSETMFNAACPPRRRASM